MTRIPPPASRPTNSCSSRSSATDSAYAYVDADDVHTAVHALLKLLPSFTASYVQWLAEYGVELG